ncbi:MAG TPA: FmdE family protein [Nitrospiria bacterium]|jgi:formylmethanofuran dehydrogenase subunit E
MFQTFEQVVAFHGHLCMDIALGYRVAKAALEELSSQRPKDEELVAEVETDSCSVDAIQAVTGCTFGKGNLFYHPNGKAAYSFYDRTSKKAIRIYCHFWKGFDEGEGIDFMNQMNKVLAGKATPEDVFTFQKTMENISKRILDAPAQELFTISHIQKTPPSPARIFKSKSCDQCKEWTMETCLHQKNNKMLCPSCFKST